MRILLQRVSRAGVVIDGGPRHTIARGLLAFVGVTHGDTGQQARQLATKTLNLRIFPDQQQRMNRSIMDIGGSILVISQFTLYADTRKGNRPAFVQAAAPELAESLYTVYVEALTDTLGGERIRTGRFGAHMDVELVNDGPVTIALEG